MNVKFYCVCFIFFVLFGVVLGFTTGCSDNSGDSGSPVVVDQRCYLTLEYKGQYMVTAMGFEGEKTILANNKLYTDHYGVGPVVADEKPNPDGYHTDYIVRYKIPYDETPPKVIGLPSKRQQHCHNNTMAE